MSKEIAARIKEENELKNEDNVVSKMGGVEEIKRVMINTIRDNEHFGNLKDRQECCDNEILKINELCHEMQKILKEELSNPKFIDIKDIVTRINELEGNERYFKSAIDELRGDEIMINVEKKQSIKGIDPIIPNFTGFTSVPNITNITTSSSLLKNPALRRGSIKDFVMELNMAMVNLNDRIDKIDLRLDSINREILEKVKKDLLFESNKILDEFRLDLKFSISKIEEQMREKVDKFNMEEFTRKFEKRMVLEMKSKIDRFDLKKNNSLINKKVKMLSYD